jgi:hypothetical protein
METDLGARDFMLDEAFSAEQARLQSPGQFWCQSLGNEIVSVTRADPVVWVSGQLLILLHQNAMHPAVSLECSGNCHPNNACGKCFTGDIIRIKASGQRYVYVTGQCVDEPNLVWEARWPD